MKTEKITAIIPVAGFSSRMKDFKPLLPLEDSTIIERSTRLFQKAGVDEILVVTGFRSSDLTPKLQECGVIQVFNTAYEKGMFSSIVTGIKNLKRERDAFFLLPADIPLVRPFTVKELIKAFKVGKGEIVYPVFDGMRGHPPLISSNFIGNILNWPGEGGLKACLEQFESRAAEVVVADEGILFDLDTPDDYSWLMGKYARRHVPTVSESMTILEELFSVEKSIVCHCKAVCCVAGVLGRCLSSAGCELDLELITAAGLLHDLAKTEPDHAAAGAQILTEMGYPGVAEIVENHMDITVREELPVGESEVVYLADKLVQGDRITLDLVPRFNRKLNYFSGNPSALAAIAKRLEDALKVKARIESAAGRPLEKILASVS